MTTGKDFAFEIAKNSSAALAPNIDAVDMKITASFTAGTVIIGVVTSVQLSAIHGLLAIPYGLASLFFVLLAVISFRALWPVETVLGDNPEELEKAFSEISDFQEAKKKYWEGENSLGDTTPSCCTIKGV